MRAYRRNRLFAAAQEMRGWRPMGTGHIGSGKKNLSSRKRCFNVFRQNPTELPEPMCTVPIGVSPTMHEAASPVRLPPCGARGARKGPRCGAFSRMPSPFEDARSRYDIIGSPVQGELSGAVLLAPLCGARGARKGPRCGAFSLSAEEAKLPWVSRAKRG